MNQMQDQMPAAREHRPEARGDSRIGTVKREATDECDRRRSPTTMRRPDARMWRNVLTAATANQQALARAGADLEAPMMPGRAADLIVPMPDPPPQVMRMAHDRVLAPAPMVRDAGRAHVAEPRMGHQPMVHRAVAATGAIARTLGLVLIHPQDALPTVHKAPAQRAPVVDDDPAKTTRDPIDRKLVREHVQPRNQEVRPAYVGMKDLLRDGEGVRG
jgi:hypothetical protein